MHNATDFLFQVKIFMILLLVTSLVHPLILFITAKGACKNKGTEGKLFATSREKTTDL